MLNLCLECGFKLMFGETSNTGLILLKILDQITKKKKLLRYYHRQRRKVYDLFTKFSFQFFYKIYGNSNSKHQLKIWVICVIRHDIVSMFMYRYIFKVYIYLYIDNMMNFQENRGGCVVSIKKLLNIIDLGVKDIVQFSPIPVIKRCMRKI